MAILALTVLTLALVGVLDYLTGYQISFAVFYLVPVGIAAWYAGRTWGVLAAILSSFTWYGVELAVGQPYDHPAIPIWNASVRLVFFLVTCFLLSTLRQRLATESEFARTDSLTGLANSRTFLRRLEHDLAVSQRIGNSLTLAYIDLDDFKRVNDQRGHAEGDRQLRRVAKTIAGSIRNSDTAGRLGGDEFALVLPATDKDGATVLLEKLALALRAGDHAITCSIGAVVFGGEGIAVDDAVAVADRLMYSAKQRGKNQFVVENYSPP